MRDGDVLVSRYFDEESNDSPGYWNHSAIYFGGEIVEALSDRGVVKWVTGEWLTRVERYAVYRHADDRVAETAGRHALTLLGVPYRLIASLFRYLPSWRTRRGLNCVAVVRLSYREALSEDPKWVTPDDITSDSRFSLVETYP